METRNGAPECPRLRRLAVRPIPNSGHMTSVRRHGMPDVAYLGSAIRVRVARTFTPSRGGLGGELHWQLRVAECELVFLL